jgi:phenylalanine-4-hydroxylase
MQQEFEKYNSEDLTIWKTLFERQEANLFDKVSQVYLECLKKISPVLNANELPNFKKLNEWFKGTTNWQIECVPGLIPVDEFFNLLSQKKFCSSTWLRSMDNLDYLEEPDMFHDIFGHVPLLADDTFSEFLFEFGKLGAHVKSDPIQLLKLQRLYWFTIEFGLIKEKGNKIYGAGLASSFGESTACLAKGIVLHEYDLEKVFAMDFETDQIQNEYFLIDSYEQLFESILSLSKTWKRYEVVSSRK